VETGVCVIVIGFDDVRHVGDAVRSALDQGPDVTEVVAVDDASTDGTGALLDELAVREPRLRVLHRTENSGGCGTPRNDGLRAAAASHVMFLDSDDVLPPGAVPALLAAARRHGSQVTAGACVRRELPDGGESRWQRALYVREAVYETPEERPRLVRDTLCVNKLYDRAFLRRHGITFPGGAFRYEDFPFTARVLAAAPRIALIPDTVYVWHVRRRAAGLSLSLDRDVANWQGRLAAHRSAVEVLRTAGADRLAHAAQAKFLDHDLRLYMRELPAHDPPHRRAWWQAARSLLAGYSEQELRAARAPARWLARVLLAAPEPPHDMAELHRLAQLASRPARLLPPYATDAAGRPVWSAALPQAVLDGLGRRPRQGLPVAVDGVWTAGPLGRDTLRLRVHEIHGQLAAAGPHRLDLELRHRATGRSGQLRRVPLHAVPGGWAATVPLDMAALAARQPDVETGAVGVWDVRVAVRCADGRAFRAAVRPVGPPLRRRVLPVGRRLVLLVQPYRTSGDDLAVRLAPGLRGAARLTAGRLRRLAGA
jgi:glycosyltransferase involved in cell wall biosynthesis